LIEEGVSEVSTLRKVIALVIVLLLAAVGISLQMTAVVGIAPFDALNQTLSFVSGIRVGDVVTIVNVGFVLAQVLLLRKDTTWSIFLQFFVGLLLGQFVNLFYYTVFGGLVLENYFLRMLVFIIGCLWVPIFIGSVMVLDLVTMPVENFAMVLSNKTRFSFGQVRQAIDVICVIVALGLTFIFTVPLTIREGTIISALTFGPLLSFYMPKIEGLFRKWQLIDY
jgi:uncharacterized membrane protein YczE